MRKKTGIIIIILAGLCVTGASFFLLLQKPPIKLGFLSDFSPKSAVYSVNGRNGVLMAVDEINASGGVHGRLLELVSENNGLEPEICRDALRKLLLQGVQGIIGPFHSSMARVVMDEAKNEDILIVCPTVSGRILREQDDNMICINSSADKDGFLLARALVERGDENVAIVYSGDNVEYSGTVISGFKEGLAGSSVEVIYEEIFYDTSELHEIVNTLIEIEPDGILLSSNGRDGAEIMQQYTRIKDLPHLYSDQWMLLTDVLSFAGHTAEGLILVDNFSHDQNERDNDFKSRYFEKYSIYPNYAAVLAYEAVMVFYYGVERAGPDVNVEKIKNEIINKRHFQGVYQDFHIDSFGDGFRNESLVIIKNGEYSLYE
ncbi:MAG: ABC transporter substrate-binding protein [Spirochaetales bacterium]|nr:ABC transporter substrate-binding protein [Spirochaetales bacterium]